MMKLRIIDQLSRLNLIRPKKEVLWTGRRLKSSTLEKERAPASAGKLGPTPLVPPVGGHKIRGFCTKVRNPLFLFIKISIIKSLVALLDVSLATGGQGWARCPPLFSFPGNPVCSEAEGGEEVINTCFFW